MALDPYVQLSFCKVQWDDSGVQEVQVKFLPCLKPNYYFLYSIETFHTLSYTGTIEQMERDVYLPSISLSIPLHNKQQENRACLSVLPAALAFSKHTVIHISVCFVADFFEINNMGWSCEHTVLLKILNHRFIEWLRLVKTFKII